VSLGKGVGRGLAAPPGTGFHATIDKKGLALDPRTRQGIIWAKPKDEASAKGLLPGMYGQAEIALPAGKPVRCLPTEAIIRDGIQPYVVLEDTENLVRRSVVTGTSFSGFTALEAGQLAPGDRVVTTGAHELASLLPQDTLRPTKEAEANIRLQTEPVQKRAIADIVQLSG